MDQVISALFVARDTAHILHLKTKSFAAHMALGDLYDGLVDLADCLAEAYQGKYGLLDIKRMNSVFNEYDNITFIKELATWAEKCRDCFNPEDTNLLNEWDNVISLIYKTKYKLENLS